MFSHHNATTTTTTTTTTTIPVSFEGYSELELLDANIPWFETLGFDSEDAAIANPKGVINNFRCHLLINDPYRHYRQQIYSLSYNHQYQIAIQNTFIITKAYDKFERLMQSDVDREPNDIDREFIEFDRRHTKDVRLMLDKDIDSDDELVSLIKAFLALELPGYDNQFNKARRPNFVKINTDILSNHIAGIVLHQFRSLTLNSPLLNLKCFYKDEQELNGLTAISTEPNTPSIPKPVSPYVLIALLCFAVTANSSDLFDPNNSLFQNDGSIAKLQIAARQNYTVNITMMNRELYEYESANLAKQGIDKKIIEKYMNEFFPTDGDAHMEDIDPWCTLRSAMQNDEICYFKALLTLIHPLTMQPPAMQPISLFKRNVQQILEWEMQNNTSRKKTTTTTVTPQKSALDGILAICNTYLYTHNTITNDVKCSTDANTAIEKLKEAIQKLNYGRFPNATWQFIDKYPKLNTRNTNEMKCFRLVIREFYNCFPHVNLNLSQSAKDLKKGYAKPAQEASVVSSLEEMFADQSPPQTSEAKKLG